MKKIDLFKYHHSGKDNLNGKSHFHSFEFEILHVLSGDGIMMIKDKLYSLKPNMLFFISGDEAHYSSPENSKLYMRNKIIFPKEFLIDIPWCMECIERILADGVCAVRLTGDLSLKVDECFLNLNEAISGNCINNNLGFFVNLISIIDIAEKSRENNIPYIKNKISDVIGFINKNLHTKLTLDIISQKTNITKYYLCHSFSATVGMTVFEYIQFVRLAKAKQLLSDTDDSILDIALSVGFDNPAYFSKVFREQVNMTPGRYRKISQAR